MFLINSQKTNIFLKTTSRIHQNSPDHMVNFSIASSWVLESSASIIDVCVYGNGDPKHVLYLSTSQVVLFLHLSSNIVPFGNMTAAVPESQAAQTQSIA